jgi:CubicO group peptidase (beta-lactamase class C family)
LPYRYRKKSITEMPLQEIDGENNPLSGAGGIISCAADMAIWLQFLLNRGKWHGQSLIAEETFEQMLTPHIFINDPSARSCYGYEFTSYGLGWGMRSHKGIFLVEHDGMADGFYTLTSMMPRAGLGIVALSNGDAYYNPVQDNLVPNIVTYTFYDRLLDLEPTDWNQRMRSVHDERLLAMEQAQNQPDVKNGTASPPSHPIESYLGDYAHPGYGQISIRKAGDQLRLVLNEKLDLPLVHHSYDIFEAIFEIVDQRQKIAFSADFEGEIHQIAIPIEPRVNPVLFTRVQP